MSTPTGLNATTCANAIVDRLTEGQTMPEDSKNSIKESWRKIMDEMFSHIINNMKVTVTIPAIPGENFTASVNISGTDYPVVVSPVTIPANTVTIE